jgi:hypothetical protein
MLSGLVGIWIDPRPTGAPREVITYGEEAAVMSMIVLFDGAPSRLFEGIPSSHSHTL